MPGHEVPRIVNLIQAVPSLLYVPIYLSKDKLLASNITMNILNPKDTNGNEIVGDDAAFDQFREDERLHFCVCDPMMIPVCDANLDAEAIIVGALIKKVALCAMTKDPHLFSKSTHTRIFNSAYMIKKNVMAYSQPSTAGAVAAYYRVNMIKFFGDSFNMHGTKFGLELQYLDEKLSGLDVDVVITADLLAYEAHYDYNEARTVLNFAKQWPNFFFTGIIAKRFMLKDENKPITEEVLRKIKESMIDLYQFGEQGKELPAGFVDGLVRDIKKYTRFHLHPKLSQVNYDEKLIIEKALREYIRSGIPAHRMEVDFDCFCNAFDLRRTVEKDIKKTARHYFSKAVSNDIATSLDNEYGKNNPWKWFTEKVYIPYIVRYRKFWAVVLPLIAGIIASLVSKGSVLVIGISVISIFFIAMIVYYVILQIEKQTKQ